MMWLCLELPALRLEAVVRGVADAAQPLALVDRNRIEYCNAAAAECGVAVGSSLATAASLCRGLRHFGRNTVLEQARLKFLAATLYRFSDRVSLHEPAGNRRPAALLLEVSGSLKLFGGKLFAGLNSLGMAIFDTALMQQVGRYNLYTDEARLEDYFGMVPDRVRPALGMEGQTDRSPFWVRELSGRCMAEWPACRDP